MSSTKLSKQYEFIFDTIDVDLIHLKFAIPPEKRIQAMLNARRFLVNAIRSRLEQRYPDLSAREINIKLFEEIEHAKRIGARI